MLMISMNFITLLFQALMFLHIISGIIKAEAVNLCKILI